MALLRLFICPLSMDKGEGHAVPAPLFLHFKIRQPWVGCSSVRFRQKWLFISHNPLIRKESVFCLALKS
jgi:hypothetical protein